jgi:hypothetical protein
MAHKLDIFDVMAAVDKRNKGFLEGQSPEARKGFAPPVALRWASTVQGPQAEAYLICVNEFANGNFHDLYEHPDLQFKLLTLAGSGKSQRHQWIPITKQAKTATPVHTFVSQFYPLANHREIDMLVKRFTADSFQDFVHRSGCSPEEAKEIISVFNKSDQKNKR